MPLIFVRYFSTILSTNQIAAFKEPLDDTLPFGLHDTFPQVIAVIYIQS